MMLLFYVMNPGITQDCKDFILYLIVEVLDIYMLQLALWYTMSWIFYIRHCFHLWISMFYTICWKLYSPVLTFLCIFVEKKCENRLLYKSVSGPSILLHWHVCLSHLDSQVLKTSGCPPTFLFCSWVFLVF